ncbi:DUF4232 domain-containing protein [Actinoplanes rectilineatus]|uniref:DUF4232 domain-containing protein n=1 Tax=Actinoplanes rectilineatus TaxID=113571 RepID=UPI0005F29908|nr:DUF4232 domain-containing protein [Actinoplanes rectilineatus]
MRDVLKATVPAVALMTALAACGQSGDGASGEAAGAGSSTAPGTATTEPADATATPESTTTTGGSQSGGGSTGSDCATDDLAVTIAAQGDSATAPTAMVVVTNNGEKDCTVHGWLTFTLVNAANEAVEVPTEKVEEPGPAVDVKIIAGGSAFAGIKWTTCDKGDSSCGAGNTIRWDLGTSADGPAAELEGFPAAEKSNITMKSLKVGTLQPSRQGVVAW